MALGPSPTPCFERKPINIFRAHTTNENDKLLMREHILIRKNANAINSELEQVRAHVEQLALIADGLISSFGGTNPTCHARAQIQKNAPNPEAPNPEGRATL